MRDNSITNYAIKDTVIERDKRSCVGDAMILDFADFPPEVQRAFQASAVRTQEVENHRRTGAAVAVEAIIIADHVNGIIYTTRDGGQTFEAEKTAKQAHGAGISTRRVLRISETKR